MNITSGQFKKDIPEDAPEYKKHLSAIGYGPSRIHVEDWKENPWLPYLLTWKVSYYPTTINRRVIEL
jgi:hypothetical protein